ncbi:tRNA(Thr) (cytosine(32)-N(3))-methyltransferase [Lasiodiplodia hormozganensis]|uniref:tRNA(Thr) (Cytosine(32)-N(3))-methyltransferase n=1 Tax=Lasiodiplodia hormozganensis TaxID=869390 RepID=A0AA39WCI9_9PEZI|nr:tRNA(Thr) (cytosine(32)-N(3))-methyltransferase [Lasiodiplodia hormozganensis]
MTEQPSPSPSPPAAGAHSSKKTPKSQLSKGMEHIRYAVTVDPAVEQQPSTYGVPNSVIEPVRKPASSRSHDPSNNQKRSDPFQFGSRYLEEGDNIFEFNAWDHVEVDDAYREFAECQYSQQRENPVSDFDKQRFNGDPAKWWNLFYKNNQSNFFKNRKWLFQEFPVLEALTRKESPPTLMLETGAGAGNTAFPILKLNENPNFKIHACDFSKTAVDVMRRNEAYDNGVKIQADVWDVAGEGDQSLPPGIQEGTVDVVLMVFIFSALAPSQWAQAVRNIYRVLKPGGYVLFRDYGRGDLAQVRFKKGRYLDENFYVRGDGTRVYFFEKEELEKIWGGNLKTLFAEKEPNGGDAAEQMERLALDEKAPALEEVPTFNIESIGVDRRMLVNRQRRLKMYRCWMQAVYRKPGGSTPAILRTPVKPDAEAEPTS